MLSVKDAKVLANKLDAVANKGNPYYSKLLDELIDVLDINDGGPCNMFNTHPQSFMDFHLKRKEIQYITKHSKFAKRLNNPELYKSTINTIHSDFTKERKINARLRQNIRALSSLIETFNHLYNEANTINSQNVENDANNLLVTKMPILNDMKNILGNSFSNFNEMVYVTQYVGRNAPIYMNNLNVDNINLDKIKKHIPIEEYQKTTTRKILEFYKNWSNIKANV